MNEQTASNQFTFRRNRLAALVCAAAGGLVFQFAGNATQGYIHTRSLFYWWSIQWFDPAAETQHGLLVLLVAVWLLWRNLHKENRPGDGREQAGRVPLLAMMAGMALHLVGFAMQQTRLSIAALLLFVWGVLTLAGGRSWGRAAVFPLGFMLLAVPVSFIDTLGLGFNLRLVVTEQAAIWIQKFGITLLRSGTQLLSADGHAQYDVAAACSGVRSLLALFALALLVGYLGLRSWFARVALAAACLPFVVAGNIVRIMIIVLAAEKFGGDPGSPRVHDAAGIAVFFVVLGLLLLMLALLRRVGFAGAEEPRATRAGLAVAGGDGEPSACGPSGLPAGRVAWVVVLVAVCVGGLTFWLERSQQRLLAGVRLTAAGAAPLELPDCIGTNWLGQRVEVTSVEREVLPADTGYSRKNYARLGDPLRQVFFSVVLSGRDRTSIHRPELCLVGQGWTITGRSRYQFSAGGETVPATFLTIEHAARDAKGAPVQVKSLLAYWFVGGESIEPTHAGMQWRDALDRVRHLRADRWAYVVVQTILVNDNAEAGLARMQEVVAGLWPMLRVVPAAEK